MLILIMFTACPSFLEIPIWDISTHNAYIWSIHGPCAIATDFSTIIRFRNGEKCRLDRVKQNGKYYLLPVSEGDWKES